MNNEQIIYQRFRAEYKQRVRALWREELRAEFTASPNSVHSPDLDAVLTYFRLVELKGKLLIVALEHWRDYRIAKLSGIHGAPVEYLPESYASVEDATIAIFNMRVAELLID